MLTAETDAGVRLQSPKTLDEAGLSHDLVTQLALKTLHFAGELPGTELARRLGLPFLAIEPVLAGHQAAASLRDRRRRIWQSVLPLSDHRRGPDTSHAFSRKQSLRWTSPPSRSRSTCRYMESVELSLQPRVDREALHRAFEHLVIGQRVLDQLGPAINAGHSMFVYGPPGNGKTVISQAIHNLLVGDIYIPHALEVEGSIIRLFDAVNHQPVPEAGADEDLDLAAVCDRRWIRCRRPMITVGGELSLDQLELSYSPAWDSTARRFRPWRMAAFS